MPIDLRRFVVLCSLYVFGACLCQIQCLVALCIHCWYVTKVRVRCADDM